MNNCQQPQEVAQRIRLQPAVVLTPIAQRDESLFLAAVARSQRLHQPWVKPPSTPEQFGAFVCRMQEPVNRGFLVRPMGSDELSGFIEITHIVRGVFKSGYLGYYAFLGYERQGLMSTGLRLVVRKAFTELKLHRLEANIQPENLASIALVRRCGFVKEGYSKHYLKIRGRWRDHERWAILAH